MARADSASAVAGGVTIVDLVTAWGRRDPDRLAMMSDDGAEITYGELARESEVIATLLRAKFPEPVRIGINLPNSIAWVFWSLAIKSAGHTLVSINDRYDAGTVEELLARTSARAIVSDQRQDDSIGRPWGALNIGQTDLYTISVKMDTGSTRTRDDETTIVFTSGTGSTPKGIALSHANEVVGGVLMNYETGLTSSDTVLITTPFSHRPGQMRLFVALAAGARVVIAGRKYSQETLASIIRTHQVTTIGTVPTSLHDLIGYLTHNAETLDCVRTVHVAGDAMPPSLIAPCRDAFPGAGIYVHYSSTEAGYISVATQRHLKQDARTVGVLRAGVEIRIVGHEGYEMPDGEEGEIWVRSGPPGTHTTAIAYIDDESGTLDVGANWIRTGDLGRQMEDLVWVTGRTKNIVISGGMNISIAEVESAISEALAGKTAVCAGIPDDRLGQRLVCFFETELPEPAENIREKLRTVLASYKVPRHFGVINEIPRTPTGKIQRRSLPTLWKEEQSHEN